MLGLYDSSFYYYKKCLTFTPDRAECYTFMGLNYANLNKFDSSVAMYNKAIEINKYSHNTYILAAKTYIGIGKFAEAKAIIAKALDVNPFNGEAYFVKGLLSLYDGTTKANQDKAMQYFSKCIELSPEIPEAYLEKGRIFDQRRQLDSAQFYYEKAFQRNPNLFVARNPNQQ